MTHEPTLPGSQDRVVRVFVSSTFRDMHPEREELVKRIFPQIRKLCEERGVAFVDVDLRWGVTDEERADGKVLPICLQEIRNCRPFFIGLLGERYGWVPEAIPQELVDQEPWLAEHRSRSVTELEILHGVLNNPAMANRACFYFRDPAYVDRMPEQQRVAFTEENPDRRDKLAALKERILRSGLATKQYGDPQELGQLVLRDLAAAINQDYPPGPPPDALEREAADHEGFARSRARVYIGRPEYFDRLDEHAAGDGPPLVVLGESGSGKSALLANWALRHRASHPDDLLVLHFVGATPYSADWASMLRRIMAEFQRRLGVQGDIPSDRGPLRQAFANWLHMAAARGRLVLILDGLNQLEDRDQAPDLVWLPPDIPARVRLIVSTLPGRPLDDLRRRHWPTLTVAPLEPEERKELASRYLAQYRKSLDRARLERIATAPQAACPLYLRLLLEELRQFGVHERLDQRIGHYLAAGGVPQLYERVLERYEQDYEVARPGLVGNVMTLLWAARRGLSETELLALLGSGAQPLPRAHLSPLFLAAEHSLVSRSGLIGFFHDHLREAVRSRYLPGEAAERGAHLRLADYFARQALGIRKVDELPWQLAQAKSWEGLRDLLADMPFFAAAIRLNQFDLKTYWAQIEGNSPFRLVDAYRPVLERPDHFRSYAPCLAMLFEDTGHASEAMALAEHLVDYCRRTGDRKAMASCLGQLTVSLMSSGDEAGALRLAKEHEDVSRELGQLVGLAAALGNQAVILMNQGDGNAAMALLRDEEGICRESGNKDGLARSLANQASMLQNRGDLPSAQKLLEETERLFRELGNKDALATALGGLAQIHYLRGDLERALELFREEEGIFRSLGNKAALAKSLGNVALIQERRGDSDGAMQLLKEKERLCRELGDTRGLAISLGYQGSILANGGDPRGAMALLAEQEQICRAQGYGGWLASCLEKQAGILADRRDYRAAVERLREAEELSSKGDSMLVRAAILEKQARISRACGHAETALRLYAQVVEICRGFGDPEHVAICLYFQAQLLVKELRRPREAVPLAEEAYRLAAEHGSTALAEEIERTLELARSKAR